VKGRPPTEAEKNWSGDGPLDLVTPAPPPPATDPQEQQIEQIYGDKGAVERIVVPSAQEQAEHEGWTPLGYQGGK
jgi:hypothetical protein